MHLGISLYHVLVASLAPWDPHVWEAQPETSLSGMSYICLSDDLCHCDKLMWSDWCGTVDLLFHEVFAGVVTAILAGLNSHSELIKMHDCGRQGKQQAHAVNSKEAVYNLTQTSVLIRHSCSETAL